MERIHTIVQLARLVVDGELEFEDARAILSRIAMQRAQGRAVQRILDRDLVLLESSIVELTVLDNQDEEAARDPSGQPSSLTLSRRPSPEKSDDTMSPSDHE